MRDISAKIPTVFAEKTVLFPAKWHQIKICGDILTGVAAIRQQMLILYYQRLYLVFSFFKVANENPLLAICASDAMSKPLHPHINTIFIIIYFETEFKSRVNKLTKIEN